MGIVTSAGMFDNTGMLACKVYVYLFVVHDPELAGEFGYVKFGQSKNPLERAASIKTGCPVPLVRLTLVQMPNQKSAYALEQALLKKYTDQRSQGEWVRVCWGNKQKRARFFQEVASVIRVHSKSPKIMEVNPSHIFAAAEASRDLRKKVRRHPSW